VEALKKEQRDLQRKLNEEEIAVRARIAELEERATSKKVGSPAPAPEPEPPPKPPDPAPRVPAPAPATPIAAEPPPPREPPVEDEDDLFWESKTSIRARLTEETDDPEVLKALKAFRKRT
jgi:hypothetical protein